MIKKEVYELVKKLKGLETSDPEWQKIIDILQRKYKMTAWTILGLFENPPSLEYTEENRKLLLEEEK